MGENALPTREMKMEEANREPVAENRPYYRSWKKKYRKMRIKFDQEMHEGESLHRKEQKAFATCKRLAVDLEYVGPPGIKHSASVNIIILTNY
jgi:hypothetical protein